MINGWIMSGDTAVASFHGRVVTPILPERCPLCFQKGGDLEIWLESRAIDRHRTNSRILKRILRLGDTSDLNTALHVHGATITDNYWVKTEDEANLTWADVGFRENYFADLALSGRFSSIAKNYTPKELRTATPELTNIGSYEKCWRQKSGHWIMVKSGTPEEHFSEIFTIVIPCFHVAEIRNFIVMRIRRAEFLTLINKRDPPEQIKHGSIHGSAFVTQRCIVSQP